MAKATQSAREKALAAMSNPSKPPVAPSGTSGMADFRQLDQASSLMPAPAYTPPKESIVSLLKRTVGSGALGFLEGAASLQDKISIADELSARMNKDFGTNYTPAPLITPTQAKNMESSLGLKGTLAENIWRGIGEETPSILASYGAVGAASKIPAIGKFLTGSGKALETGRRGVAAGALYTPLANDNPAAKDYVTNMALFGVGDMAVTGALGAIGKGIGKLKGGKAVDDVAKAIDEPPDIELKIEKPSYAPWVNEDLIKANNVAKEQNIVKSMTAERNPFEGMYENQYSQIAPDYIPPQGVKSDFYANPLGSISRNPSRLALPSGEQPLMLPKAESPKMLPEGTQTDWFVDQYGNIRNTPETPLMLGAGRADTPSINLKGKKGNIKYPEAIEESYKAIADANERIASRTEVRKNWNQLGSIGKSEYNPLDDVQDLVIIGANKIKIKGLQYAEWAKEMVAEYGEIIRENLPYIWHRSKELNLNGETKIKLDGVERLVRQADNELPKANTQAEAVNATTGKIEPSQVKSMQEGGKERGFSANTRTDANNPAVLRESFDDDPLMYNQLANKETLAKARAVFDQGYESALSQLNDLTERMQPEAAPLAKMLARQASEAGNVEGAREIIATVAAKLTQAGQFGQAAKILRDADPETFMLSINKQLRDLNKEGKSIYGDKWKEVKLKPDELDMVGKIERGNQKAYDEVLETIRKRIANELPASAMEKVNAWRHMAMLLNPKTQVRNIGGNLIMAGMRQSSKQISALMQKWILPAEQRTQVWKVQDDYLKLAKDHFEANKKDLLAQGNKYIENIKLNMPDKRVYANDTLEATRKLTYKLLEMGDVPFYRKAYINRLASYAQAKGIKNFADLPEDAFKTAQREAEQATYKDASGLAEYLNKAKNPDPNAGLGAKAGALVLEAAMPFTKTPINIIKRGIQYSPVSIINGLHMMTKNKQAAAEGIDELAKGLTGTAIIGLGYLLASDDILTGKAAEDADMKAYNANTGNAPFSVMGKFTYDWAMPFSVPLAIGVEVYNAIKGTKDEAKMKTAVEQNDTEKLMALAELASTMIYSALAASTDTAFNMSVMKSLKSILGNPQGVAEGLSQLPQNYASQFMPTALGQLAGVVDPTVRQTYVKGNMVESAKNTLINKVPFASRTLEPKQTPFGEDVKRLSNPLGRLAAQTVIPGNIAVNQNIDPAIDAELRRLNEYGFTKQFPTMTPNYIEKTKDHPKITLTQEEATQYQKRTGQLTQAEFKKIINSYAYINTDDDEKKADMLADAIKDAKAQAKAEILAEKGYKVKSKSNGFYTPW